MGLSTAERNKRKRERKKKQKQLRKSGGEFEHTEGVQEQATTEEPLVEYVAEPLVANVEALKRFQERQLAQVVSDDEENPLERQPSKHNHGDSGEDVISKRKLRESLRPSVAQLKQEVDRPDLVEAHDVTAFDPHFLIHLKAVPGTVPIPRHWGRKRKYLQGKRGFEKPPFRLPDFIIDTGIAQIRDTLMEDEANMSARQKNRQRVAPKMGAIDVDYRTLHNAFFKYQTKPKNMTRFGEMYYEGKETEVNMDVRPGAPLSAKLKEALGMTSDTSPVPWLINMQRYGPPPTFGTLSIPGLTAPLPSSDCQYGYHAGGWGKPPTDTYGRPLYGGNPFDPPGSSNAGDRESSMLVTSDGKMLQKNGWGSLPTGEVQESDDESSDDDMEESSSEEEEDGEDVGEAAPQVLQEEGKSSVLPPPTFTGVDTSLDLRKPSGSETPAQPKHLYQTIQQTTAKTDKDAVFASDIAYLVPTAAPGGAESVLAKSVPKDKKGDKRDEEDESGFESSFKF